MILYQNLLHYIAKDYWNGLPREIRSIEGHKSFKTKIRSLVTNEFIIAETARLSAGLFADHHICCTV